MTVNVEEVVRKLGLDAKLEHGRWWVRRCPLPKHTSQNPRHEFQNFFVVDNASGQRKNNPGQYHCYSCKGSGRLVELVVVLLGKTFRDAIDWLAEVGDVPAPPYLKVRTEVWGPGSFRMPGGVESLAPLAQWLTPAREYAMARGITDYQVSRWSLTYAVEGEQRGRIVLPTHGSGGVLANYTGRTFVGGDVRYLSAPGYRRPDLSVFWGELHWPLDPSQRRTLVLCEGALNGLALERAGEGLRFCLAGLSGSRIHPAQVTKLAGWREVVLATDPDAAGDEVAEVVRASLRTAATRVARLRYPEPGRDAGDTTAGALRAALLDCSIR